MIKERKSAKLKAIVVVFALVFAGFAALITVPNSVLAADPTVTNEGTVDVGTYSATVNASISQDWFTDYDNVTVWFVYNTTGNSLDMTTTQTWYNESLLTEAGGYHHAEITGLMPDTEYDYQPVLAFNYNATSGAYDNTTTGSVMTLHTGPEAVITANDDWPATAAYDIWAGQDYLFEGANSVGTIDNYTWTIEGMHYYTNNVTHSFAMPGTYDVTLEVTNDTHGSHSTTITVRARADVHVTVLDNSTANPIEEAEVLLEYGGANEMGPFMTDANGTVTFTNISFSDYFLIVSDYDYVTKNVEFTDAVATTGMIENTVSLMPKAEYPIQIGPVVDSQEFGVPNAAVTLTNVTGASYTGTTDTEGTATIMVENNPLGKTYSITITHPDFQTYTGEVTGDASGEITLEKRINTLVVGQVVDVDTGDPISQVKVAIEADGSEYEAQYTNATGYTVFELSDLENITTVDFVLTLSKYEYQTKQIDFTGRACPVIEMTPKSEFSVSVGPVVEVVDDVEYPIQAEVTVDHDSFEAITEDTLTDGTAQVMVPVDPRGVTFDLTVTADGYKTVRKTFTGMDAGKVIMQEEEMVTYTVEVGPVKNSLNKFVSGAIVMLSHDGSTLNSSQTDSFGTATITIDMDPEGTEFSYRITRNGYETATGTFTGDSSGEIMMTGVSGDYDITIGPINDQDGNPVEGASVTLTRDGTTVGTAETGANGQATITATLEFAPSNYQFTATVSHDDLDDDATYTFSGDSSGSKTVSLDVEEEDEGGLSTAMIAGIGVIILIIIIIIVVMMMQGGKEEPVEEFEEEEFGMEEEFGEEEELFGEEEEEELFEEEEEFGEEEELFEEEEEEELFEEEEEEELFEEEEDELFEEEEEEL